MKKACIVSIGNELLSGTIVDTNTAWLCTKLMAMGIPVVAGYTLPDEIEHITRALKLAAKEADIIVITGGLGPTDDDLTRQAIAEVLVVKLVLVPEAVEELRRFFSDRGLTMPQRNMIQAYMPAGAQMLHNSLGTAPGVWWHEEGKVIVSMPGVPSEMMAMFEDSVKPRLKPLAGGQVIRTKRLHCFGAGESAIAEKLGDMMSRDRNPLINTTASVGLVTLYIVAMATDEKSADAMVEADDKMLHNLVGEYIYGRDGQTLAEVTGQTLARAGKTMAVAESCTGGLLAKMLTDVAGSSSYFMQGWVTYSNESKVRELCVPPELIEQHGAVSRQVAEAMAKAARKRAGTDFSVGITGIAGPDGGTAERPVGLVYISADSAEGTQTRECRFMGNREAVRLRAALTGLDMVRRKVRFD